MKKDNIKKDLAKLLASYKNVSRIFLLGLFALALFFAGCKGKEIFRVFYNEKQSVDYEKDAENCYFKAGIYTQSNLEKGDSFDAYAR